jgi:hypothetical protein
MDEEIKIQGNIDINQALKEFETKSSQEQMRQTITAAPISNVPKIVQLVIKWSGGAIKEERQAEYVLLGFVIVAIIVSLFLILGGGTSKNDTDLKLQKLYLPGSSVI